MDINKLPYWLLTLVLLSACNGNSPDSQQQDDPELVAACHYIQGGGSQTTGGQGGATYVVSSLEDGIDPATNKALPGTLRYAVEQGEARIVVFRVAGTIHLVKPLTITKGNLTIAGQSAPGDGICIADYPIIIEHANNIIIRFVRCRLGNKSLELDKEKDYDALSINDSKNIVIDHCSFSWSVDECVSCYGNENFTLQYCFITESLRNAGHVKGAHGYGGIWGGKNATFHHNLLAHHDSRNPRFDHDYVDTKFAGPIDYVNNVVYNWGGNSTYGGEGTNKGAGGRHINFVNNYYKNGPSTKAKDRLVDPTVSCSYCTKTPGDTVKGPKIFLTGNIMFNNDNVSLDNWSGSTVKTDAVKATSRWTDGLTLLTKEESAEHAFETVLAKAGCSLKRDSVDARIVNEVRNGGGKLIDRPSDVGGWPVYSGTLEKDTDYDGIPDAWEEAYGLNPSSFSDSRKQTLVSGISNIEVYLNAIVADLY